jgi:hypothetical protein
MLGDPPLKGRKLDGADLMLVTLFWLRSNSCDSVGEGPLFVYRNFVVVS